MARPRRGADQGPGPGAPLPALLLFAVALGAGLASRPPAGASAEQDNAATVQEILDGHQVYIEQKQARVRDSARVPDRLRTGNSRAQVAFRAGGTARINRFSQLRLGTSCFFLAKGQVLVSGPQNGCTRSSRLSVRGTNYLISVPESGPAELTVLEGQVLVEAPESVNVPAQARPTAVFGGNRVSVGRDGAVSDRHRLSEAEVAALLSGPLFQGFLVPLSHQQALQTFLQRAYPNLRLAPATAGREPTAGDQAAGDPTAGDPAANALQGALNSMRQQQGRPPFQALPAELASRNRAYLKPVQQAILSSGNCDHDRNRWSAFQASLAGSPGLRPSSEVLTCGPTREWDPKRVVSEWLSSPLHHAILLERPRATSLGCSSLSQGDQTVAICTLWSPNR
ncbi:MAG: FecR domain-containing protein [Synechococcaceae cyanobacterium ELA739]